jgi:integrase
MATFRKTQRKRGVRWTARVRIRGREITDTFSTKGAAETWARAQEHAIETGEVLRLRSGQGVLFADLVEDFIKHRGRIGRAPGKTFANALKRLKLKHGDEPLGNLDFAFWRKHALDRIADGAQGQTVASELAYAGTVLQFATREGHAVDHEAPGKARTSLREEGVRVVSRERTRRVTDTELVRLFKWIDTNARRTSLPLRDLVEFALATGLRRGEILALTWNDIDEDQRIVTIKRKHPRERDRIEQVPLLKPRTESWPRVDALAIIKRQPKRGLRVFPYVADTLGFWFEQATAGAELKDVVFHSLRHEALSRLAQDRGFDPLRLALIGGHRDMRNVKRYAKLDAASLANE